MIKLALLGKNISHSKSPEIYKTILKSNFSYDLIDCESSEVVPTLGELSAKYHGINITAPYKKLFLDKAILDDCAKKVQAINCLLFKDNQTFATNTDYEAFKKVFVKQKYHLGFNIILLGSGAMAQMAEVAFFDLSLSFKSYNRRRDGDLNQIDFLGNIEDKDQPILFVNCCSRDFHFNPEKFSTTNSSNVHFFDLNYSSEIQKNLCVARGFSYYDGLDMLNEQARLATVFWSIV